MYDSYDSNHIPKREFSENYKKSMSDVTTLLRKIENKEDLANYFERKYLNE